MSCLVSLLVGFLSLSRASPLRGASDADAGTRHGQVQLGGHRHRPQKLHGRFLHITDLHPDPFYKVHSSTEEDAACHRGFGPAGFYGAETTDCDSPFSLIDETFKWIDGNLRDSIDFVIWTGDSARHANDERIPRTEEQILNQNRYLADKFVEIFRHKGAEDTSNHDDGLLVPVIPTIGNNDVMPHNYMNPGPNRWTRAYADIWRWFIPKTQQRTFEKDGWFTVEVIPDRLAVISMNTMYFFTSNTAVDGCGSSSEPGYAQFEWLRVELQRLRERGMKAILMGHVPPAKTESKMSWYESCWQKYTLWNRQYRDVLVGSMYGHMNIGHFFLQDAEEVDIARLVQYDESMQGSTNMDGIMDGTFSTRSATDYLIDLRHEWTQLPRPPKSKKKERHDKQRQKRYLKEIGGEWAERYIVTHVSPSVIPNAFPSLRVMEYNISGLEDCLDSPQAQAFHVQEEEEMPETEDDVEEGDMRIYRRGFKIPHPPSKSTPPGPAYFPQLFTWTGFTQYVANITDLNNDFVGIDEYIPSTSSPSTRSTSISFDSFHLSDPPTGDDVELESHPQDSEKGNDGNGIDMKKWHPGKFSGREPPTNNDDDDDDDKDGERRPPKTFHYEIAYRTQDDPIFRLDDLTVRRYLELAQRIGRFKPDGEDRSRNVDEVGRDKVNTSQTEKGEGDVGGDGPQNKVERHTKDEDRDGDAARENGINEEEEKRNSKKHEQGKHHHKKHNKHKKHKKHKKRKRKAINKVWFTFIQRAFVGALDDEEIHDRFGSQPGDGPDHDPDLERGCGSEHYPGPDLQSEL